MPSHEFVERLGQAWPVDRWTDVAVVVACSGGADSTALLRGLVSLRTEGPGRLIAAHFNHRLRGDEADGDERFVVELARRCGTPCVVGRGDVAEAAAVQGDGVEAAAREARYRFLVDVAAEHGARYVVTAHTLDDQAETVLHRILRGTGLAGLAGIPRSRPLADGAVGLVRPLLGFRRCEVLRYLAAVEQPFRTDSSNQTADYVRNKLRNELLPLLARDYNPRIVEALTRLAAQADEAYAWIAEQVAPLVERAVVRADAAGAEIDCRALIGAPRHLVRELFVAVWRRCGWPERSMGYDEWNALASLALGETTEKRMFPGGIEAQRIDERMRLRERQ